MRAPNDDECDVAVVGSGAAGLRAAATAARAGASTVVIDAYDRAGGQYFRQPATATAAAEPTPVQPPGHGLVAEARAAGAELRQGLSVWHATNGELHLTGSTSAATLRYRALVVASGAHERVAAFPGWTLPGVFTAGAVQSLVKEHGVVAGRRVLFAGSGPLLLVVAAALARRSVDVVGVLEATRVGRYPLRHPWRAASGTWRQYERLREGALSAAQLARRRVRLRCGWGIVRALGAEAVEGAVVARLDHRWRPIAGSDRTVACDTIAIHHSLVPSTDVLRLLGAEVVHHPQLGGWAPRCTDHMETTVSGVFAAGDCTGIGGVTMSLVEGAIAGANAAAHARGAPRHATPSQRATLRRERRFQRLYGDLFTPREGLTALVDGGTVVCRCEESTRHDVDSALAAGAGTAAMVKSLSRCGMGPCQGRICAPIVAQLVEQATGDPQPPFTARPPLVPVPLARLAP